MNGEAEQTTEPRNSWLRPVGILAGVMGGTLIAVIALTEDGPLLFGPHYAEFKRAKDAVTYALKDPGSAEFRGLFKSTLHVCGEVNAKNSYGAYTGFKRFDVLLPSDPKKRPDPTFDDGSQEYQLVWDIFCKKTGD